MSALLNFNFISYIDKMRLMTISENLVENCIIKYQKDENCSQQEIELGSYSKQFQADIIMV